MRLLIIGAGGHSKEVADLVVACGYTASAFFDDVRVGTHKPTGAPVIGKFDHAHFDACVCAVGDVAARHAIHARYCGIIPFVTLVHPSACVSPYAKVGEGTQVMQNVVVNADAVVGENVILNVGCVVAHDCSVGAHSHVSPGANLSGGATVGEATMIGTGAIVLPGVHIGKGCTIGAGAVVTRDVADGVTVAGVPARTLKEARDAE